MKENPEKNWFGDRSVSPDEKSRMVRGVFDSVYGKYDLMNDLMSGGIHRIWKDAFVAELRPKPGKTYLDVAGGTGDIAFRIRKKTGSAARIIVCDACENMAGAGRDRSLDKGLADIEWVAGNAECLPLPDASVDFYTISFGLRNVTHIDTALQEAFRVLKPGGMFFCLEFSPVQSPLMSGAYDFYSDNVIPMIGDIVTGDAESYRYLIESIRRFPPPEELAERMGEAGFSRVHHTALTGGIAAIHRGFKK